MFKLCKGFHNFPLVILTTGGALSHLPPLTPRHWVVSGVSDEQMNSDSRKTFLMSMGWCGSGIIWMSQIFLIWRIKHSRNRFGDGTMHEPLPSRVFLIQFTRLWRVCCFAYKDFLLIFCTDFFFLIFCIRPSNTSLNVICPLMDKVQIWAIRDWHADVYSDFQTEIRSIVHMVTNHGFIICNSWKLYDVQTFHIVWWQTLLFWNIRKFGCTLVYLTMKLLGCHKIQCWPVKA